MVLRVVAALALLVAAGLGCPPSATAGSPGPTEPAQPVGVWPLVPEPEVVRGFDPPDRPWGSGHRGVDLLGSVGQPVRAALPGRVTFAGRLAGRGVVVVSHGDTRTTYEPVAAGVRVGDTVTAGERLGGLQLTGSHCFPLSCLHWGWIRGETYLNPLLLVGEVAVRLLPTLAGAVSAAAEVSGAVATVPIGPGAGVPATTGSWPDGWSGQERRSGPRVGLLVGPTQPLGGDVGVQLGGGQ